MARRLEKQIIPDNVDYWPDCDLCPKLCKNTMNVCMEGEGPENADIMFVGEATGETEDELNRPFVGQAGEYLRDDLLVPAEIPESKIRFTNSNRCHPKNNKTPTVTEIKKCRRYLEAEIKKVNPKVIVAMGNAPLASLLQFFYKGGAEEGTAKKQESKVSGITMWRGKMVWLQEFQCWLMPTFHPSYCTRNERDKHPSLYSTNITIGDFKEAWMYAQKERPKYPMPKSIYITEVIRASAVINKMQKSKEFAFDIETGGKGRSIDKRVIGCSFANSPDVGYYIPWEVLNSNKILFKRFKVLITSKAHYKIMHNGAYEVRILALAHGIYINGVKYFDTMAAAHLVDENFSKRLKALAWILTNFGGYDIPLEKYKAENRIKEDYSAIPVELLAPYGALDSVATWILYKKLEPMMEKEKVTALFNKIVMPVRRVMSDSELNGMYVDSDQAVELDGLCEQAVKKLETEIFQRAGYEFNIGSSPQLQKVLYNEMGFVPFKKTKTGHSVDAESIEYIATQPESEIAEYLLDRSYVSTMWGTHIGQAIAFRWPEDGRVHTNYNITGAVSGRASCSQPSLQNVPRDSLVRSLYTASPGNLLVEADLRSAEIATIAAVSGEETFIRAFREGLDIHSETYKKIYDLPAYYVCSGLERRHAKAINFGLVYGLTAIGLARRLHITVEEATAFIKLYFEQLPNVARWMSKQKALVRRDGYVISMFGRKRRLPYGLSDRWGDIGRAERQAMNSPIQCLSPEVKVLRDDLRWIALGDLKEGDNVISISEYPEGRWRVWKPASIDVLKPDFDVMYRLHFDDGTFIDATAAHKWLCYRSKAFSKVAWVETEKLTENNYILKTFDVWEDTNNRDLGYLAGAFDADGTFYSLQANGTKNVQFCQKSGYVLNEVMRILDRYGFSYYVHESEIKDYSWATLRIKGGFAAQLRFLGLIRPIRLLARFNEFGLPHNFVNKGRLNHKLIKKEYIGRREIVRIATSTQTFFADGMPTHNSGASDYTYIGLIRLRRAIMLNHLEGKIVHTVHDCGLADTPKAEVPMMAELFREAFETPVKAMPIKMQVDVEINKCWGQNNESRLQEIFDKVGLKLAV